METKREKPKEYNCDLKDICEFCREHIKKLLEEKAPPEKTAEDALPKTQPAEEDNHPHKKAWGIDLEALKRKRLEEQQAKEAKARKQEVTVTTEVTEEVINREKPKSPPPSSGQAAAPKQVVPTSGQNAAPRRNSEQFLEETLKKEEREEIEVVIHRHKAGKRKSRSDSPDSKRSGSTIGSKRSDSPDSKRSGSPDSKRSGSSDGKRSGSSDGKRSGSPDSKRPVASPPPSEGMKPVDKPEPPKEPTSKQDAAPKAVPATETPGKTSPKLKSEHFVEEQVVNTEAEEVDVVVRRKASKSKRQKARDSDQTKKSNEPKSKESSKPREASPPVKGGALVKPKSKEQPGQGKPKESLDEKVTRKVTVTKQTVITEHKADEDGKPK